MRKVLWRLGLVVVLGLGALQAARADFMLTSVDNDFTAEIKQAAESGKTLVIMFHQTGCPYCDKMRDRVFPDPRVDAAYSKSFVMVESNILGDLPVVTPTGEKTTEKVFARKMRVRATPMFVFYDKTGKDVLTVTGFLDADRFIKAGKYVADGVYKQDKSFYRYLQE